MSHSVESPRPTAIEDVPRLRTAAEIVGVTVLSVTLSYLTAKGIHLGSIEGQSGDDAGKLTLGIGVGSVLVGTLVQVARHGREVLPSLRRTR